MEKLNESKFSGILQKVEMRQITGGGDTGTISEFTKCTLNVATGALDVERFGDNTGDPCPGEQ